MSPSLQYCCWFYRHQDWNLGNRVKAKHIVLLCHCAIVVFIVDFWCPFSMTWSAFCRFAGTERNCPEQNQHLRLPFESGWRRKQDDQEAEGPIHCARFCLRKLDYWRKLFLFQKLFYLRNWFYLRKLFLFKKVVVISWDHLLSTSLR